MGCLGTPSPKAFQWLLKGSDIPPLRRDQKNPESPFGQLPTRYVFAPRFTETRLLLFEQVARKTPASSMSTVCAWAHFHQSPARNRGIHAIVRAPRPDISNCGQRSNKVAEDTFRLECKIRNQDHIEDAFLAEYSLKRRSEALCSFHLEYTAESSRDHIPLGMESARAWDVHRNVISNGIKPVSNQRRTIYSIRNIEGDQLLCGVRSRMNTQTQW